MSKKAPWVLVAVAISCVHSPGPISAPLTPEPPKALPGASEAPPLVPDDDSAKLMKLIETPEQTTAACGCACEVDAGSSRKPKRKSR